MIKRKSFNYRLSDQTLHQLGALREVPVNALLKRAEELDIFSKGGAAEISRFIALLYEQVESQRQP